MIQEGFPRHDWITVLAGEQRKRDAVIASARNAADRGAALVRAHGPRLLDALAMMVAGDVARFCAEFPDDAAPHIVFELSADEGFEVRRTGYPAVALKVTPQWASGVVACRYRFTPDATLPVREDRFALGLTAAEDEACFKHQGSGAVFADVATLSEYLLTPAMTGRPRVR